MKIIQLVEASFIAKKEYGANSRQFKFAQAEALKEIDAFYKPGTDEIIKESSDIFSEKIGIRIQKKIPGIESTNPSDYCSFSLVNLDRPERGGVFEKTEKRCVWEKA